jgi:acetyl-CoA carboxylase carboxyltransferase component
MAPAAEGLGLECVLVRGRLSIDGDAGKLRDTMMRISDTGAEGMRIVFEEPSERPLMPLSAYEQKVVSLRRRGLTYPYEIIRLLAPDKAGVGTDIPRGAFIEHDLDPQTERLVPVDRPPGGNTANVVVGVVKSFTARYPEGLARVILIGDPSREMGALAEPECARVDAAIALAGELGLPLEWFALSAGAKISMQSGTENMDWVARVLRSLILFTQRGGEVNIIVCGINVGAQPYWNAESTMLMHTRGILVMMPQSAMVLTGKLALDYSGSVSAEDNIGIGGYDRIMGPNGQAQYFARDLGEASAILLRHYEYSYRAPGERFPRPLPTTDPIERDVRTAPHGGEGFATVGEVFSEDSNPGRKRPFEIRRVMAAVIDQDHRPLERWAEWPGAELAVVWDAALGGQPVCLIGIESRPVRRLGFVPADGPETWTAGTLFPQSSKKVARAINATSGTRPLVVLANLSGFDGSPESMRKLQLEYGAEIGRAVVNFDGPIAFCVVSRYHGGAFVVFSRALNPNLEAIALEGTHASVIGGAPAAAVVFSREVEQRVKADPAVRAADDQLRIAETSARKVRMRSVLAQVVGTARAVKLGEVASEFDAVHSVERALRVGSLDRIIPAARLRPYLIEAIKRGMAKAQPAPSFAARLRT